jgi:hypothetical protein
MFFLAVRYNPDSFFYFKYHLFNQTLTVFLYSLEN